MNNNFHKSKRQGFIVEYAILDLISRAGTSTFFFGALIN